MRRVFAVGETAWTTGEYSERVTIIRASAAAQPMPGPDWRIVRFAEDGGTLCMHVSSLMPHRDQRSYR